MALGNLLSQFGSQLTGFALSIWVFQTTKSLTIFGLMVLIYALPRLFLGPLAGHVVDRTNRKTILIAVEVGAAFWVTGLLAVHTWFEVTLPVVAIFLLVLACFATLHSIAFSAGVAQMLPPSHRMAGNSIIQVGIALIQILAPILAGLLMHRLGLWYVLVIDIATFGLAVLFLLPAIFEDVLGEKDVSRTSIEAFRKGWGYIRSSEGLLRLALFAMAVNLVYGATEVLLIPLILSYETSETMGRLMAMAGLGFFLGGMLGFMLSGQRRKVEIVVLANAAMALALVLISVLHNPWTWALAITALFASLSISSASSQALWQNATPLHMHGRVFAVRSMMSSMSMPLGYLMAPILAEHWMLPLLSGTPSIAGLVMEGPGKHIAFLFLMLGCLLLAVAAAAWRSRKLATANELSCDTEPPPTPEESLPALSPAEKT